MNTYFSGLISAEDRNLFSVIVRIVSSMPDINLGDERLNKIGLSNHLSCHLLTRALAHFFPFEVKDGFILNHYDHSWLVMESGLIIDPYPVAILGGPILLDQTVWKNFYGPEFSFLDHRSESFVLKLKAVTEVVRRTMIELGFTRSLRRTS